MFFIQGLYPGVVSVKYYNVSDAVSDAMADRGIFQLQEAAV